MHLGRFLHFSQKGFEYLKGELDCFYCKAGGFLRLFTSMFAKKSNYNLRFSEKINSSIGNT